MMEEMEEEGWEPLRKGAPDFLFVKAEDDEIEAVKFVEVKSPNGKLTFDQAFWRRVLKEELDANYEVRVVE